MVARPSPLSLTARSSPWYPFPSRQKPPPATRDRPRSTHLCLDCPNHRKPSPPQSIKVRRCVKSPHRRADKGADLESRAADWFAVSLPLHKKATIEQSHLISVLNKRAKHLWEMITI